MQKADPAPAGRYQSVLPQPQSRISAHADGGPGAGVGRTGRGRGDARNPLGSHGGKTMKADESKELQERIGETFRRIGLTFPYLVGLIQKIRVHLDERIDTIGIFASGRLLVNPKFV